MVILLLYDLLKPISSYPAFSYLLSSTIYWTLSLRTTLIIFTIICPYCSSIPGLGIYLLNQLIGFISPQFDPEEADADLDLPTSDKQEFRPFARRYERYHLFLISFVRYSKLSYRPFVNLLISHVLIVSILDSFGYWFVLLFCRLPEFKFWYSCFKAVWTAFFMTFFGIFDVPVFWPILLGYFLMLFAITMKRQIKHMIKHKYVPFTWGKAKYQGGKASVKDSK